MTLTTTTLPLTAPQYLAKLETARLQDEINSLRNKIVRPLRRCLVDHRADIVIILASATMATMLAGIVFLFSQ